MAWAANMRRIVEFRPGTPVAVQQAIVQASSSTLLNRLPIVHAATIQLPADSMPAALDYLRRRPEVLKIHRDPSLSTDHAGSEGMESNLIAPAAPPQEGYTWNLLQIALDQVALSVQGAGIHVAVVDTGINARHPALAGVVVGGYNAVTTSANTQAAAGEGGDGEGGDSTAASYFDCNGHGTHVAGIIAGSLTGVAPRVQLHAVRVLDCHGGGYASDLMKGLSWVYEHPEIRVVNMSLGFYQDRWYPLLHRVLRVLHDAGVVLVASAGNYRSDCLVESGSLVASGEGGDGAGGDSSARTFVINALGCNTRVKFPARYLETIAVAASGLDGNIAYYSIHGPEVDVTAPGGTRLHPILSTNTAGDAPAGGPIAAGEGGDGEGGDSVGAYGHSSGTSMAAPHVAGVAALMLSVNPALSAADVQTILRETADDLGHPMSAQGAGRINAARAVAAAASWSGGETVRDPSVVLSSAIDTSATLGNVLLVGVSTEVNAESQIMDNAWINLGAVVGGNNTVGTSAWVEKDVRLGSNVASGHQAYIGWGTRVGDGGANMYGTLLGDHTVVGSQVSIGNNVYVGHYSKIKAGTRIGDRTMIREHTVIGAGATIGTNVVIGSNVRVCDGEVIVDGTVIPHGTTVGACLVPYNNNVTSATRTTLGGK